MDLPAVLVTSVFEPKGLYYFTSEHLNTDDPHYFVMVIIDGQLLHMVVCTKQYEKKVKYIEYSGNDPATLVWIKPDAKLNELKLNSYINCNEVFSDYTLEILEDKLKSSALKFRGHISDAEFYNVLNGILMSTLVDDHIKILVKKAMEEMP